MSTNKHEVIRLFKANPLITSTEIGDRLDCDPAYVRATLKRAGLRLFHARMTGDERRGIRALGYAAKNAGLTIADIKAAGRKKLERRA